MTDNISKLVNLKSLDLLRHSSLRNIPDSVSRLQQLRTIYIVGSPITEVPFGLEKLAKLAALLFCDCGPLRFPRSLQVSEFDGCGRPSVGFELSHMKGILQGQTLTYLGHNIPQDVVSTHIVYAPFQIYNSL